MLKKLFAAVIAATMVLGVASFATAAPAFPDTAGIPEEPHIARLKALGIITGDADGKFNPEGTFTRIQAATIAVRLVGRESAAALVQNQPTIFPDVEARHQWAWGYINVAVAYGLVRGTPEGKFEPDREITQLEAAVLFLNALGYTGQIVGGWPLGYMMLAADLGLIGSDFNAYAPATRAFVAKMADIALEQNLVKEDKEEPGTYNEVLAGSPAAPISLYKKVFEGSIFGQAKEVTAVDTTNKKITVAGVPTGYDSAVIVYGKDKVTDIVGHYIVYTTNKNGAINFIQVVTPPEAIGVITEVDGVNNTITIGGVTYAVDEGAVVVKNDVPVEGALAVKLANVLDCDATVYFTQDGKVHKIVATYIEKLEGGTITAKKAVMTPDGLTYYVTLSTIGEKPLAKEATLVKNGQAATWSSFKAGDTGVIYAVNESDEIVYLDVWNVVEENLKVVSKGTDPVTGDYKVTLMDSNGASRTYVCVDSSIFYNPLLNLGCYATITLDRDGKISAVAQGTAPAGLGTIASTAIATEAGKVYYYVVLNDGTTYKWENVSMAVYKNGVDKSGYLQGIFSVFNVGDYMKVEYTAAGVLSRISLFSPGVVEGVALNGYADPLVLRNADNTADVAVISVASDFAIKFNGVADTAQHIPAGAIVRITWNAPEGKVATLEAVKFADATKHAVSGWDETDAGVVLNLANDVDLSTSDDTIIVRNGAPAKLADIRIGDKVLYDNAANCLYIEAFADTTKPALSTTTVPTAVYSNGVVTVTLTFTEELYKVEGYVDGQQVTFNSADRIAWTATKNYPSAPQSVVVSFTATDYAGNKLVLTRTVTLP